jgi:metallo-beta-lactamase class B
MRTKTGALRLSLVLLLGAGAAASAHAQSDPLWRSWNQPAEPYRIVGNLYSVGSNEIAVFLVATPEGHILVNSGFPETVPLIQEAVRKLGFRFEDVKVLLTSHVHIDHAGGHARVKELTGGRVMVAEGDVSVLEGGGKGDFRFEGEMVYPACRVDRVLKDGDTVSVGGTTLTARLTPGHTKGCTTWTAELTEDGRPYRAVILGSVTVNPGVVVVNNPRYPDIAESYARSFRVLESLPVDVFLAAHVSLYDGNEKAERLRSGARPNPFIDPQGYKAALTQAKTRFNAQLERERTDNAPRPDDPPARPGGIHEDVPARIDPQARYVLYLHGRILETQGRKAVSPDFGPYQYDAILGAFASRGFEVISEVRTADVTADYARTIAGRVRKLLQAGVPAAHVTVVGASKGGFLAAATSAELGNDGVSFVVLAGCGDSTLPLAPKLRGRMLSVYDEKDRFRPSCHDTFAKAPGLREKKEVVLTLGLDHGLLYTPRKEWMDLATGFARGGR